MDKAFFFCGDGEQYVKSIVLSLVYQPPVSRSIGLYHHLCEEMSGAVGSP